MAPLAPHGRLCAVQSNQIPYLRHLSVASRRLHAVRPRTLAVLEQELAADLLEVAALERLPACAEALEYRLHRVDEHVGLHVLGLSAKIERASHAQVVVELAGWVGVDGERAARRLRVHGDQLGPPAPNDGDEGRRGEREEVVGRDG